MMAGFRKSFLFVSRRRSSLQTGKVIIKKYFFGWVALVVLSIPVSAAGAPNLPQYARLDQPDTTTGYLARLLINEVPFPGERAYESEADTKDAMAQILWVLHSRIHLVPQGYTQAQVAGVRSQNIIDVITGTGERRQCEGFYRNKDGQFVTAPRVEKRINYLLNIANSGNKPGRFSELLNYAQELSRAYVNEGIEGADRYAELKRVEAIAVTGHAYSWMTDVNSFHPGGNFVTIPSDYEGSVGGNRFFTLRKVPK
jgi:hypothetical protein